MNGDPAGLEPADSSGEASTLDGWRKTLSHFRETAAQLEAIGEYKAAREVDDAAGRFESEVEARAARERLRSGKTVHGEDPQAPLI